MPPLAWVSLYSFYVIPCNINFIPVRLFFLWLDLWLFHSLSLSLSLSSSLSLQYLHGYEKCSFTLCTVMSTYLIDVSPSRTCLYVTHTSPPPHINLPDSSRVTYKREMSKRTYKSFPQRCLHYGSLSARRKSILNGLTSFHSGMRNAASEALSLLIKQPTATESLAE